MYWRTCPAERVQPARQREVARIRRMLLRLHSPRLHMGAIVALTGLAGFLSSALLLHAGMHTMWQRYPTAVLAAYIVFLMLVWAWLRLRGDAADALDAGDVFDGGAGSRHGDPWNGGGGRSGGGGASASFESSASPAEVDEINLADVVPDGFDADEGIFVAIVIAMAAAAALGAFWLVWAAPTLLAEILLDATLSAGLYRRLRHLEADHWVMTALRKTGWFFLVAALILAIAGAASQALVPGADSIGDLLH